MDKDKMEHIEKAMNDLELILSTVPDYALGRRRGYTDEETEKRANDAIDNLYEVLDNLVVKQYRNKKR